jgi:autotransporter-associated beta strand protein
VIQDGNATPENIQKNNNGALRLTNTNTYTGTTTIAAGTVDLNTTATTVGRLAGTSNVTVNSNGTLMLSDTGGSGSADRINDAATMTLNGGTFTTGGLSEHGATNNTAGIGALTLQSNSVLNLGNGASVIAFANSSAQAWAASITLSIFNWTGSPGGGGTDQVYFGNDNTGLTASQLAEINFFSDNGLTPLGVAQILGNGEIVPVAVPEPGTWVAGGLVCLALVKTARRRSSSAA